MVSIKDRKILRQMFSHYDYVMTTAQLSKEKLYYRDCRALRASAEHAVNYRRNIQGLWETPV